MILIPTKIIATEARVEKKTLRRVFLYCSGLLYLIGTYRLKTMIEITTTLITTGNSSMPCHIQILHIYSPGTNDESYNLSNLNSPLR